ncbi:hypothetical protein AVEN_218703-1 [Araneus ventricosus]|uniref:CCHC-type domain-containing protein n=1 Tax=Araneus ventricosus TaxID=182803 RepID=A0A4Y2B452_ARAVE|nr:hypothetical protein AVEN_218703-1 [Araneus ventricosus]
MQQWSVKVGEDPEAVKEMRAIIYPKQEGEQFNVKQKVQSVINPAKLQIGIKNVKNISKGALLIECGNEENLNKIKEEVESNELLKDEVAIRSPVKVNPKIIIYRVDDDLNPEVAIEALKEQNEELQNGDLKHEHIMKTPRGNNWILSIDPESFQKITRQGKVNLGWYRLNIKEYIRPRQCFHCYKYGHIAKNCLKQDETICMKCGEQDHRINDCLNNRKCANCAFLNTRLKTKIDLDHDIKSRDCEAYYR